MPVPDSTTTAVLDHLASRPATLGPGRLLCVDGPAGSGKTTLAGAVLAAATRRGEDVQLVHADELLHGWAGLPGLAATLAELLAPLARGEASSWRRWDWLADTWAESHPLRPGGLLVLEGVGTGSRVVDGLVTTLVWVETDAEDRLARGIARDGEEMRAHWERWMVEEAALHLEEDTRARADLRLDGRGRPLDA